MVKYFKGIFLLGCFYFNSENYGSYNNIFSAFIQPHKEEGCCKELFCCGDRLISPAIWSSIITLGGSLIGVIISVILKTRFKRLIRRRIRARKKEVKKYGIIKDGRKYTFEFSNVISGDVCGPAKDKVLNSLKFGDANV